MNPEKLHAYRSYLVRCWQEEENSPNKTPVWRFSVEEVSGNHSRQGFKGLEELFDYLQEQLLLKGNSPD